MKKKNNMKPTIVKSKTGVKATISENYKVVKEIFATGSRTRI